MHQIFKSADTQLSGRSLADAKSVNFASGRPFDIRVADKKSGAKLRR